MEEKFSRAIINYLEKPQIEMDIPKLPARLKIHEFLVSNNLLYRVTELHSKELSWKEVKTISSPTETCPRDKENNS